ncbi:hypothetical protein EDB87DRAFT_1580671 [Lactarius vividus]|nr:hypothetical protein EDB87DRAFT_1580671 [Lactarius vividus]
MYDCPQSISLYPQDLSIDRKESPNNPSSLENASKILGGAQVGPWWWRSRLCRMAKGARERSVVGKGNGAARSGIGTMGLHGPLLVWVVAGDRERSRTLPRDARLHRSGRFSQLRVVLESLRPRAGAAQWGKWGTQGRKSKCAKRRKDNKDENGKCVKRAKEPKDAKDANDRKRKGTSKKDSTSKSTPGAIVGQKPSMDGTQIAESKGSRSQQVCRASSLVIQARNVPHIKTTFGRNGESFVAIACWATTKETKKQTMKRTKSVHIDGRMAV